MSSSCAYCAVVNTRQMQLLKRSWTATARQLRQSMMLLLRIPRRMHHQSPWPIRWLHGELYRVLRTRFLPWLVSCCRRRRRPLGHRTCGAHPTRPEKTHHWWLQSFTPLRMSCHRVSIFFSYSVCVSGDCLITISNLACRQLGFRYFLRSTWRSHVSARNR